MCCHLWRVASSLLNPSSSIPRAPFPHSLGFNALNPFCFPWQHLDNTPQGFSLSLLMLLLSTVTCCALSNRPAGSPPESWDRNSPGKHIPLAPTKLTSFTFHGVFIFSQSLFHLVHLLWRLLGLLTICNACLKSLLPGFTACLRGLITHLGTSPWELWDIFGTDFFIPLDLGGDVRLGCGILCSGGRGQCVLLGTGCTFILSNSRSDASLPSPGAGRKCRRLN